jgi:AsmA protein
MGLRRWRWCVRIACGLVLVPLLLWLLVLLIVPTGWARRQLVARLEARSGRRVALDGVSLGLTGKIRLTNLQIGSPRDTGDPWLKATDIRLDFGLFRMLCGHCQPARIEVSGVDLRVLRRGDGTIELADLIRPAPPRPSSAKGPSAPEVRVSVQVRGANLTVIDEPTRTRVSLQDAEGEGYADDRLLAVEQLRGSINGGEIRLAARLDRTASALAAEVQLRADDVPLDDGMKALRYIVPVLAGASSVKGRLDADLHFQGHGPSWPELCRGMSGHGAVSLKRVALDGTPLFADLARFADLAGPRRLGSVRTEFAYQDGRITTDHLTLNLGRLPVTMSGWSDLDGRIDYQMKIEGLSGHLPDRVLRLLGELKVEPGSTTALKLRGTLDRMVLQVNGVPVDTAPLREPRLRPDDRERLRLLGRQLRDRVLR